MAALEQNNAGGTDRSPEGQVEKPVSNLSIDSVDRTSLEDSTSRDTIAADTEAMVGADLLPGVQLVDETAVTPVKEDGTTEEAPERNSEESFYDELTTRYSQFALGEDKASQAWELYESVEIPEPSAGNENARDAAGTDLQDIGADIHTHIFSPEQAKLLKDALDNDSDAVSGAWADPENKLAYIKIDDFLGSDTAEDVRTLLDGEFKDAPGIILDLRGNPGGQVGEAIETAALFADEGLVMSERKRVPNQSEEDFNYTERLNSYSLSESEMQLPNMSIDQDTNTVPRDGFEDRTDGTPIVILADEGTYSSAEVLLSALRQNKEANAEVVGEQTGGKGVAQIVLNTSDGGMMTVTNSQMFRPDGSWAGDLDQHRYGEVPDHVIASNITDTGPADIQYNAGLALLREKTR